jgi:hypothetical protein
LRIKGNSFNPLEAAARKTFLNPYARHGFSFRC